MNNRIAAAVGIVSNRSSFQARAVDYDRVVGPAVDLLEKVVLGQDELMNNRIAAAVGIVSNRRSFQVLPVEYGRVVGPAVKLLEEVASMTQPVMKGQEILIGN